MKECEDIVYVILV